MAVSRAPKRTPAAIPEIPEDKVQEIIRRGGSVAADLPSSRDQAPDTAEPNDIPLTDELKNVQLRLYESTLQEIDQLRRAHARGRRPISRHSWLLEAIEEKLEKERRKRR
ncbi:hypothetical protein [Deinococcus aquatilis]|uniref:hypothetical protein n=1 Tax=Deinococcus aquatilis TaxID=519440 RepID=UPI000366907B|nr:hypothetical protein [Deinococcus aquatilis]